MTSTALEVHGAHLLCPKGRPDTDGHVLLMRATPDPTAKDDRSGDELRTFACCRDRSHRKTIRTSRCQFHHCNLGRLQAHRPSMPGASRYGSFAWHRLSANTRHSIDGLTGYVKDSDRRALGDAGMWATSQGYQLVVTYRLGSWL